MITEDEIYNTIRRTDIVVGGDCDTLAEKVYEEISSRTCENCKSFTEREDVTHLCAMGNSCGIDEYGIPTVLRTWGCIEFERKQNEN